MYSGSLGLIDPATAYSPGGGLPAVFPIQTTAPYGGTAAAPVAIAPTALPPIGVTNPYTPFTPTPVPTVPGKTFWPTILPPPPADNPATTPALPIAVTPDHPSAVIVGSSGPSPADALPALGTTALILGGLGLLLLLGRARRRR